MLVVCTVIYVFASVFAGWKGVRAYAVLVSVTVTEALSLHQFLCSGDDLYLKGFRSAFNFCLKELTSITCLGCSYIVVMLHNASMAFYDT